MPAYRLPSPYARPPLQRRASGLALALAVNIGLLLILLTLGVIQMPERKPSNATVVNLIPESHSAAGEQAKTVAAKPKPRVTEQRLPKPPPIVLPSKPTIPPPPRAPAWIEMSKDEMAAADIRNLPKAGSGSGGDSEEVGRGPNGETLYAADWLREPTRAEIAGYWPHDAPSGWGMVACKTIPGDRVDDCIEIDQSPHGYHFASAVRQMAWQFRVKPPRKGGHALIGSWVRILIEIDQVAKDD